MIGSTAILNELPGNRSGRTFLYMRMPDGKTLAKVELRPDQGILHSNSMGTSAAIVGSSLYFSIPPMLWKYDEALAPDANPHVLLNNLIEPAIFLADGGAVVRLRTPNGGEANLVFDLKSNPIRRVWRPDAQERRIAAWGNPVVDYDAHEAPNVIRLAGSAGVVGSVYVRVTDGAEITLHAACSQFASRDDMLITACYRSTPDGPRIVLERFAFSAAR